MPFHDPVCGKRINRNKAHIVVEYGGEEYYLCCPQCQFVFETHPDRYIRSSASPDRHSAPRSHRASRGR